MNKGQALRPDYFISALPKDVPLTEVKVSDEEKHLYSLSKHKGWEILKEHLGEELKKLDDLNRQAISTGMSFEQIGYNSVVLNGVKDLVESLFNKVKDAVEATENGTK